MAGLFMNKGAPHRMVSGQSGILPFLWPGAIKEKQSSPPNTEAALPSVGPFWGPRFYSFAVASFILVFAAAAGHVVWFDAYWLFRAEPPWLNATQGSNKLLDRQMRRAKSLQALTRDYRIAFVGSSTTYHGLDPDDLAGTAEGQAFNLGISAVIADELAIVASLVAARPEVERIVIGLDYYMFARDDVPVRLDPSLAEPSGRLRALVGSVVSRDALRSSSLSTVNGADDPGVWKRNGFRVTPPLFPAETRRNDATRRRTVAAYRPDTLKHLDLALSRLRGRSIDVYITPISDAQRRVLADHGHLRDFERWRADVTRTAAGRGASFNDFSDLGARFPFDPNQGSNDYWLDNLHYTPKIGAIILERLGLQTRGLHELAARAP